MPQARKSRPAKSITTMPRARKFCLAKSIKTCILAISFLAFLTLLVMSFRLDTFWYKYTSSAANIENDIKTILRKLDETIKDTDITQMFRGDPADNLTWKFDFSEISKRRFGRKYSEITSFDPLGRNLDFFNPVNYSGNVMVLFEDYGSGIVERLLLEHRQNLKMKAWVAFEVDGVVVKNTTTFTSSPDKNYPFKHPFFRPDQRRLNCAYYVTFPIPYQRSMRITARLIDRPKLGEKEMWEKMIDCKNQGKPCPLRVYFAVTSNKLVHGVKLKTTFRDYYPSESSSPKVNNLEQFNQALSKMASAPENYGPDRSSDCGLTCYNVAPGEEVTIYSADNIAQVIHSLLFRVYDGEEGNYTVTKHWQRILVTMTWDGKKSQVKDIPLAGLFTVGTGYIREVNSLMAGMCKKKCSTRGKGINLQEVEIFDWLAYLYFEMPFWKSARITIKRPLGFSSAVVCTQINTKQMVYNPRLTGYFSVQLNQYQLDSPFHKTFLHVPNEWGHVVAINLFANVPIGTVENDVIVETENATAPVISGTGLEDYFGYVHGFKRLQNTSTILNGVPFYIRRKERASVHMYRHMILDPILFTKGIRIYIEGRASRARGPHPRIFDESSSSFNQTITDTTTFSVAMFYGRKGPGGITTDKLDYGTTVNISSHNIMYTPNEVDVFAIKVAYENQPLMYFPRHVVSLKVGQRVTHSFRIRKKNVGVILRREYRTLVPNQKAKVEVDGEYAGFWFCPQRAILDEMSLRIDDYNIHPRLTVGKETINVNFEAITLWESCSIEVICVIL